MLDVLPFSVFLSALNMPFSWVLLVHKSHVQLGNIEGMVDILSVEREGTGWV